MVVPAIVAAVAATMGGRATAGDPRAERQSRYARLPVDPPASWDKQVVGRHLNALEQQYDRARLAEATQADRRELAQWDGKAGALAGTLTLMVGGEQAAFKRTRKMLASFADDIFYLGGSGTGHTLKLIHNMVLHTTFVANCEGGRMAERAGIALEDMVAVFNVSNARSYISEVRFPQHILSRKWDGSSRVYNLFKDVGMAVELGHKLKADVTLGEKTLAFLKKGMALGMRDLDFTLLYRDFKKICKQPTGSKP